MHPVEDVGKSPWPVTWLMRTGSSWMSNNYITRCHRRLESVRGRRQFSSSGSSGWRQGASVRTAGRLGLAALSDPWLSNPSQDEEEVLLWLREELWVNMLQSVPVSNSPLTHNQHQPFRKLFENKVWEVYFYKVFIRHYCWLCFRM